MTTEPTLPEWEDAAEGTKRLRVPGGWIYHINLARAAAVFVPDVVAPIFTAPPQNLEFGVTPPSSIVWTR